MVDSYRFQYSYFVDQDDPEYKGGWNEVHNVARVFTPRDKAIQTPNADTPYSFLGADLRAEPLVISVPAIQDRYYSLQFIDMYTHNFAYVGSRAAGNGAGNYLLAGPKWQGKPPAGIKSVIRSETDLAFVLYRTQLFGGDDLENVKRIQTQYEVQPLSRFEGITPTHPSETALMDRFARAGIGAGKPFDVAALSPEQQRAVQEGMANAWKAFAQYKADVIDTGKKSSADGFGTREHLGKQRQANWLPAPKGPFFFKSLPAALTVAPAGYDGTAQRIAPNPISTWRPKRRTAHWASSSTHANPPRLIGN